MPNIKSLQISLSEEEDVSFIIQNMLQLEELNQIRVDRTQSSDNNEESQEIKPIELPQDTKNSQKIKKQPFEMKELEESKQEDFFTNNFKNESQSEFKISPVQMKNEEYHISKSLNSSTLDQRISKHLDADIISEIETTLKINQKSIQDSIEEGLNDNYEVASSQQNQRKKKSERKNKSLASIPLQTKTKNQIQIEKENQKTSIESPLRLNLQKKSKDSPTKDSIQLQKQNQNQSQNYYKEEQNFQGEQSPVAKSYYNEENIIQDSKINEFQDFIKNKKILQQNFENNYILIKKPSPQKSQVSYKQVTTQSSKVNNEQEELQEPITVEQIKNQITRESIKESSIESQNYEQLRMNIINMNKDLKSVSDLSLSLPMQNKDLQSPESSKLIGQNQNMLYIQEQTQDSNTFQSAHHMESQEELKRIDKKDDDQLRYHQQPFQQFQSLDQFQSNQIHFQNTFFHAPTDNQPSSFLNDNLLASNLYQDENEDIGRTPNQLSDIIEDDREAENENGLSKGTCNFGNSYSRTNNSVLGQTQQVQSINSNQSQPQTKESSLSNIGIGLREQASLLQTMNFQRDSKIKEINTVQSNMPLSYNPINQELLSPVLQRKKQNEDKENMANYNEKINQEMMNYEIMKQQKNQSTMNQDLQEQESILKSSRKLQQLIEEKNQKEKILSFEVPTLKPHDLEDLANIFDRIRIIFKRKSNSNQPPPKKLILKNSGPADDLAVQFDQKLTEIMQQLSKILKDNLVTSVQKNAEIEKSKFLLYIYCHETCIKFISKYKGNILQKDAKELEYILTKLHEILNQSFLKMNSLFYSKDEIELKIMTQMQIEKLKQEIQQYEEINEKYEQVNSELNFNRTEMDLLKESFMNQSLRLEEQHFQLRRSEENFNELLHLRDENNKLRQVQQNYEIVLSENHQIRNELCRLKEFIQDQNKLKKNAQIKEKEVQRLKKMLNHLQEELREMKEEGLSLFEENQKYLDMIVRYSLGQEKGPNGSMNINLSWLKQRILRKKKSIYDGISGQDFKSQLSLSNLSVSPILHSQQLNKNSIKLSYNHAKKYTKKLNDLSLRSINSQNSSGSQIRIKQKKQKNDTNMSEIVEKGIRSGEIFKDNGHSRSKSIRNISKTSKHGDRWPNYNENVFPKEGGYSNIHSYRKSIKKSPLNQDSQFNLSFQQSKGRIKNKSLVLNSKKITLQQREYEKDIDSEKSNILIKSQNSQKTIDVFQNKQDVDKEELQKTAAKKLKKVESQIIEKSCTKEIFGFQNDMNKIMSPKKFDENLNNIYENQNQMNLQNYINQDSHQGLLISVDDCQPSPQKQFQEQVNQIYLDIKNEKQMLIDTQNTFMNNINLQKGSIKHSNKSNETYENEQFFKKEREIFMNYENQNIEANQNQFIPHLYLGQLSAEQNQNYQNQLFKIKHLRTQSVSNYSNANHKIGLPQSDYQELQTNNINIQSKRSKSASPKKKIQQSNLFVSTKNQFHQYQNKELNPQFQNNQQLAQTQQQVQDIIRRKLQLIDQNKLNSQQNGIYDKFNNRNDIYIDKSSAVQSPDFLRQSQNQIRDFQPSNTLKLNDKNKYQEVASPTVNKQNNIVSRYSLKQIRELITDIYIQKVKHDDKCINMIHQNRETMEQFLYTYLNQKYGLKSIVIEQANAVVQAIIDFQFIDHDVLLFKKVLRHQLDEEFRYVQITIKNTVYQLMKSFLNQKYPSKISTDIQKIISDIENGKIPIDFWLWQKILNQMYDQTDQYIIFEKLKKMDNLFQMEKQFICESKPSHPVLATNLRAESRKKSKELSGRRSLGFLRNSVGSQKNNHSSHSKKQSTKDGNKKSQKLSIDHQNQVIHPKYYFQIFMETILVFQLNEHEKFLQKFMQLFQSIDISHSGIISNQQFIHLYKKMNINQNLDNDQQNKFQDEINQLLDIIDPYQSNKVTLSDIILLFSKHNLNMLEGNILKSSNKKQNVNVDFSVQGLNKLNDLEKTQSFNLNLTRKNIETSLESQNYFSSIAEQDFSQMLEFDKNQSAFQNHQAQMIKQKLKELQQINETTESNKLFTTDNSRQFSQQISFIDRQSYGQDQFNNQQILYNQNTFANQNNQNQIKDSLSTMGTIQKISEDEKRISQEILMLERKLASKL